MPQPRCATNFWRIATPSYNSLIGLAAHLLNALTETAFFGTTLALPSIAMDTLAAVAASGLRARMESLDLLANNIANASTGGYKADREFYTLYSGSDYAEADVSSTMPLIEKHWTDYAQGTLHSTGNALDVALDGPGFFSVNGPAGPLYTRNGNFRLASDGRLTSSDGYAVRSQDGTPIVLDAARNLQIAPDGTVTQDGAVVGQLQITDFTSTAGLTKQGSNYFRASDPNLRGAVPSSTTVAQGQLESSNTGPAESAVRLVGIMRQFEMLQKAVTLGADMNKHAIEEVAKV
jgi:flagellar basal-body rod protein FlgF